MTLATWKSALERGPRVLIGFFCLGVLVAAAFYRGHSVESLDQRTYLQMINGVALHGMPFWDNGPIDTHKQLTVFWGIPARGHVWGIYGLLYPFLYAPVMKAFGMIAVAKLTFVTLVPQTLASFALARRVMKSEWLASFAAICTVISTPLLGKALEFSPYPLMTFFATLGLYLTVRLVESDKPSLPLGLLTGIVWACASSSHALALAMAVGGIAVLVVAPKPGTNIIDPKLIARRALPPIFAFALAMAPTSYVNHIRFLTWSPVSYGYFPWSGPPMMTLGHQVGYSIPVTAFFFLTLAIALLVRKNKKALIGTLVSAVIVAAVVPVLREKILRYALVGIGYFVAAGVVDMGPPYELASDGIGRLLGPWVVKGTMQGTPIVLLGLFAVHRAGERRWAHIAILVPCIAQYVSLMLRANLINIDALGWPWVYPRYALAAYPGLVIAGFSVIERVKPKLRHLVGAAIVATVITIVFTLFTTSDKSVAKRITIVIVPVALAVASLVTIWPKKPLRPAAWLLALTVGVGIGISLGHDTRAHADAKRACDRAVDRFAAVVPKRFAILGQIGPMDVYLTTTVTHDVRYADLNRYPFGWHRALVDFWLAEDRPVYVIASPEPESPWPDVTFRRLEQVDNVYVLEVKKPESPPAAPVGP